MMKTVAASLIALGMMAASSVGAATLTATSTDPFFSSFTLNFTDTNGNNLFDIDELTGFPGILSQFGVIAKLMGAPEIDGIASAGVPANSAYFVDPEFWQFGSSAESQFPQIYTNRLSWTYSLTLDAAPPPSGTVPLPGTLPLALSLIGGTAWVARRKARRG